MEQIDSVWFAVVNPHAGSGKTLSLWKKAEAQMRRRQISYGYRTTDCKSHATEIAYGAAKEGFRKFIAAGGDGTVNEVLNGIMSSDNHRNVTMGIIPIGRGNDFAWSAGIPTNIRKAVELILANRSEKVDVGLCCGSGHKDGLYFFNGAGFGFEPAVNFRAMGYRHLNGMPSYIAAFIYILFHFPSPYHLTLTVDDEEYALDTQQISVCNGRRMGSAFLLAPKASITDGMFDVMYTTHPFSSRGEIMKAVLEFLRGSHVAESDTFVYRNARKVLIESKDAVIEAHCDGEVFSRAGSRFELTIIPSALKLIHGKEKC